METAVAIKMAAVTQDELWRKAKGGYKALILEHHMAALRLGFAELFGCIYEVDRLRTGLMDGTLPPVSLFSNEVLPLVTAMKLGDQFAAAAIVRSKSPLCDATALRSAPDRQQQILLQAKNACDLLASLWSDGARPTFHAVLRNIARHLAYFAFPTSCNLSLHRIPDNILTSR